jgi:hypothetical protein
MAIKSDVESVTESLKALSFDEQGEVISFIRLQHRKDPFHRINDCALCNYKHPDDTPEAELDRKVCEGCTRIFGEYSAGAICIECGTAFAICLYGKCELNIIQQFDCKCKVHKQRHISKHGICKWCARNMPSLISCTIGEDCKSVIENKYSQC